jgi:hypothetical protein
MESTISIRQIKREIDRHWEQYKTENKTFKGRNFITPNIIGRYEKDGKEIEISWGKGIFSDYLFGFTVHDKEGNTIEDDSFCSDDYKDMFLDLI